MLNMQCWVEQLRDFLRSFYIFFAIFSPEYCRGVVCKFNNSEIALFYCLFTHACSSQNRANILAIYLIKSNGWNSFEGELFIKTISTTLIQIVCKLMLHSEVIFKSMTGADDTLQVDLLA